MAAPKSYHRMAAVPQGAEWGSASRRAISAGFVADVSTYGKDSTQFDDIHRFLLFEFVGGDTKRPLYGWAQLSVAFPEDVAAVTLVDWA